MSRGVLAASGRGDEGLVIVGTGIAGLRVAQAVRQEGYDGQVLMVGAEPHLPYDRPPLSKQVLKAELTLDAIEYHSASYYRDILGVEVLTGASATSLDGRTRRLQLEDGTELPFSAAVVATGSRPRRLPFTTPAQGVHVLRTRDDAVALRSDLYRSKSLAVVGAGFIGAEIGSSAKSLGLDVTVIETAPAPLVRAVGARIGAELAALHERAGVRLICGKAVTGFVGRDRVEGLTLDDGSLLDADLVVVGVGVVPDVEWLQSSGLALSDGLACDAHLHAGFGTVFGAGDAVSWPNALTGDRMRSQQWTTASEQGRHLGRLLVRGTHETDPFGHDMYFWSDQYAVRIQGAGLLSADAVVLQRQENTSRLVAAYRQGSVIRGVLTVNAPREFQRLRKLAKQCAPWGDVDELATLAPLSGGDAA
jgi:NADPH-dependent 2,4-dienoyl-CoA reductase/sulfur reductase-like enzyme